MIRSRNLTLLILTALVVAGLHTFLLKHKIQVCYRVSAEHSGQTGIYWHESPKFTESSSLAAGITAGETRKVCFADPNIVSVGHLRIDPINRTGRFTLDDIRIDRLASIVPYVFDITLTTDRAYRTENLQKIEQHFYAATMDPHFSWSLDTRIRTLIILAANTTTVLILLLLALLVGGYIGRQNDGRQRQLGFSCILFALYPLYLLFAWLASDFSYLLSNSRYIVLTCPLLTAFYLRGTKTGRIRVNAPAFLVILSMLGVIILADVNYRVGWFKRPLYTRNFNEPYHWTLERRSSDILRNSSLAYYTDFYMINTLLEPHSFFLADKASSYYATAALPIYPLLTQQHHRLVPGYVRNFMTELCKTENEVGVRKSYAHLMRLARNRAPRYFILNSDTGNRNVRQSCITRHYDTTKENLLKIARLRFKGDHLLLFEFERPQADKKEIAPVEISTTVGWSG